MARTSSRTPHNHLQEKAVYLIRCPDNTARSLQLIMFKCVSTYTWYLSAAAVAVATA